MPYVPDQQTNVGSFVATTNVWDVSRLYEVEIGSPEFKELMVRLYQNVNNIATVLNTKNSALYLKEEFVTGQQYFNPTSSSQLELRAAFRKVVDCGALAAGVKNILHGLAVTTAWKFTLINGVASNTTTRVYYPLPFAGVGVGNISVSVNATQVVINNNSGVTFTDAYVTLEYVKS